ncbi:MAG: GNAT family N-acetyltransferase, partial [Acholeplasmataceae bacterium]|nr:GNAT family N-acetyltransferase [Acholeplasmataceae bacterium]
MELYTKHLKLRPIQLSDVDDIFNEFTDEITKFMYVKAPKEKIETIHFIEQSIKNYENHNEIVFTVCDQKTSEFLGLIGAHEIDTKTPELGLWLKKAAQGHHYGLEGLQEVIKYLKELNRYDYFVYRCDRRNIASRRIAFALSGIPQKTFNEMNQNNVELHYVMFHIYPNDLDNISYPTLLFQGDSITDCNRKREQPYDLGHGYVSVLANQIHHALLINKGISGNRTVDLLDRWSYDTIALKPDFLSILVGINEVWHHYKYGNVLTPAEYKKNYITLLERVKKELPQTKILMI